MGISDITDDFGRPTYPEAPPPSRGSLPRVVLGCAALGGVLYNGAMVLRGDARDIIARAYDRGVRAFQTDPAYGDPPLPGDAHIVLEKCGSLVCTEHRQTREPRVWGWSLYAADLSPAARPLLPCIIDWHVLRQHRIRSQRSTLLRSVFARGHALTHEIVSAESARLGITPAAYCLGAALQQDADGVVIGPTSVRELDELLDIAERPPRIPESSLKRCDTGQYADLRAV